MERQAIPAVHPRAICSECFSGNKLLNATKKRISRTGAQRDTKSSSWEKSRRISAAQGLNGQDENGGIESATQQITDSRNKLNRLLKQSQKRTDILHSQRNEHEQTRRLKEEQMRQVRRRQYLLSPMQRRPTRCQFRCSEANCWQRPRRVRAKMRPLL